MNAKPRVAVDTNIWISAALFADSIPDLVLKKIRKHYEAIISQLALAECIDVFSRGKFDPRISYANRLGFLAEFCSIVHPIEVTPTFNLCRDPKDNHILDLAVQGGARYIVTGDADLLALHPFYSIAVVSPAMFIETTG